MKKTTRLFLNSTIITALVLLETCSKEENTSNTVKDIDGNLYHTVTIGTQTWMVENLRVTHFNDGTPIDMAKDTKSAKSWPDPLYCWYNNDPSDPGDYGILYNYRTVHQTYLVPLYIAPKGWHVPTDEEWNTLISNLGGSSIAGGKMKALNGWNSPNSGATNESGFTALPGGTCSNLNSFTSFYGGDQGYWWSSTYTQWNPSSYVISSGSASILNDNSAAFNSDFRSIRCIKN